MRFSLGANSWIVTPREHDDLAFGDRRVGRRESLRRRFELVAVATPLLAPPLGRASGPAATGEPPTTAADRRRDHRRGHRGRDREHRCARHRARRSRRPPGPPPPPGPPLPPRAAAEAAAAADHAGHRSDRHAGVRRRGGRADRAAGRRRRNASRRAAAGRACRSARPDGAASARLRGCGGRRRRRGRGPLGPASDVRRSAPGARVGAGAGAGGAGAARTTSGSGGRTGGRARPHDAVRAADDRGPLGLGLGGGRRLGLGDRRGRGRGRAATGAGTGAGGGAGSGSGSGSGDDLAARPRQSARRRTRSAEGSSMLDEWLFTPILSSFESSTTTWLSTPSSRASS